MNAATPHETIVAAITLAAFVASVVIAAGIALVAFAEARAERRRAWLDARHAPLPDDGSPCITYNRATRTLDREVRS